MGYCLLLESMLGTVLHARDNWLVEDPTSGLRTGVVLPNRARMFVEGMSDVTSVRSNTSFWKDVYGFDMSVMVSDALPEVVVDVAPPEKIFTSRSTFKTLDMQTMQAGDAEFTAPFTITAERDGPLHAFVISFATDFDSAGGCHSAVELRTTPADTLTHWKQTILLLEVGG